MAKAIFMLMDLKKIKTQKLGAIVRLLAKTLLYSLSARKGKYSFGMLSYLMYKA